MWCSIYCASSQMTPPVSHLCLFSIKVDNLKLRVRVRRYKFEFAQLQKF